MCGQHLPSPQSSLQNYHPAQASALLLGSAGLEQWPVPNMKTSEPCAVTEMSSHSLHPRPHNAWASLHPTGMEQGVLRELEGLWQLVMYGRGGGAGNFGHLIPREEAVPQSVRKDTYV